MSEAAERAKEIRDIRANMYYEPRGYGAAASYFSANAYAIAEELSAIDATTAELRAENERLKADARRYRWIHDQHIQMSSPKMDGQHCWRFRCNIRGTGNTPDEAIDKEISGTTHGGE